MKKTEQNRPVEATQDPEVTRRLVAWYEREGRDLPWRRTSDAYRIWLSEVILQQTRVVQGLGYYERILEAFPRIEALAAASEDQVLKLWQGLGYYSRARNLHAAARIVAERYGGCFPEVYDEVRALPGVGDYTAAAICSAAYDAPHAAIDGNVYRVLTRLYDLDTPIDTAAGRKECAALAEGLMDRRTPGHWNQAMMDFGATCCTPVQPRCETCPLQERCLARAAGTVAERPVKRAKKEVKPRYFNYLHIESAGRTLLHRREGRDIWRGLYEFPLVESAEPLEFSQLAGDARFEALLAGAGRWQLRSSHPLPPHQLSHRRIHAVVHRLTVERLPERPEQEGFVVVDCAALGDYAVPRLIERYLER